MKNSLIIGIDLSFNSTGISISKFNDTDAETIEFHRLIYDDDKTIKKHVPKPIYNINQYTYKFPTNISVKDIIISVDDYNSYLQTEATIKSMICIKRLMDIIVNKLKKVNDDTVKFDLFVNIEGFLMPQVQGENQFKSLSGLIMLQGLLRSELIKLKLSETYNMDKFKLFITAPKELKLFFSGNGNADKQVMLDSFLENWDGKKLLPDTSSLAKINDVVDAFALMMICYGKIMGITELKKKKPKKIKVDKFKDSKFKNSNILLDSLPTQK